MLYVRTAVVFFFCVAGEVFSFLRSRFFVAGELAEKKSGVVFEPSFLFCVSLLYRIRTYSMVLIPSCLSPVGKAFP